MLLNTKIYFRITGEASKVEHAKQLVYELIAEKEMQLYQRGNSNYGGGFQGGNDGVEVKIYQELKNYGNLLMKCF